MSDPILQARAIEAITAMNAAVRNLRLYPPGSAMIETSLEKVQRAVNKLLAGTQSVVFAESEKNLLISDTPLSEKELQKPQLRAFLELMLDLGVRSLTLRRGLDRRQLKALLLLLRRKPEEIEAEGGLGRLAEGLEFTHILVDQKLYVAIDKGEKVVAADDEDEASEGGGPVAPSPAGTGDAGGADRISRVLYSGIQPFADLAQGGANDEVEAVFNRLITDLAGLTADEGPRPLFQAAERIAGLDDAGLGLFLSQSFDSQIGRQLHREVIARLDVGRYRRLSDRLRSGAPAAANAEAATFERAAASSPGRRPFSEGPDEVDRRPGDRAERIAHLKSSVASILRGDRTPFRDREVVQALPGTVEQLLARGKDQTFVDLMRQVGNAMDDGAGDIRTSAAGVTARVFERLPEEGRAAGVQRLLPSILGLAARDDPSSPAMESLFAQIRGVVQAHIRNRQFAAGNRIIEALCQSLRNSRIEAQRAVGRSLLRRIADESTLKTVFEAHGNADDRLRPVVAHTLTLLQPASAEFLLDRLRDSEETKERGRIMRLLPEMGPDLRPVLIQRLGQGGPWFYLRNLAALLGKIGQAEDLEALRGLLRHEDLRIQREALSSIFEIGGERRGEILLTFLPMAEESVKLNVVAMLGALSHRPAVEPLGKLLAPRAIQDAKLRDEFQEKVCTALGRIGTREALPALEGVLQPRGLFGRGYPERVQEAARQAIDRIESVSRRAAPGDEGIDALLAAGEAEVDRLAAAGDVDAAVARILDLVRKAAAASRFDTAERLRERLYEVDAMALAAIIEAGEIIEAEKGEAIDTDHLEIFADLYGGLSEAERNALYHAAVPSDFAVDEPLVRQGEANDRLFFVEAGEVKIVYLEERGERLVQRLQAGSLVGAESFFKATVATVSAVALDRVRAFALTRDALAALHGEHPGLESKLQDFALARDDTAERLRRKGMDRRTHKRYKVSGRARVQLLGRQDRPAGRPFGGQMADVSIGGISFDIKSAKPETARLLLGRRVRLGFALPGVSPDPETDGTIIGVNYLLDTDYSLHVRFDRPLDPSLVETLETAPPEPNG